jgi:hypothetical protein
MSSACQEQIPQMIILISLVTATHILVGPRRVGLSAILQSEPTNTAIQGVTYSGWLDPYNVGYGAGYVPVGYTDSKSPNVNAIAYDYGMMQMRPNEVLRLWVYELGNALRYVTGENPALPANARQKHGGLAESGAALEDCVFDQK